MADQDEKIPHIVIFYVDDVIVNVGVVWGKDSSEVAKEFWKDEPKSNLGGNARGIAIWKLHELHPLWKFRKRDKK